MQYNQLVLITWNKFKVFMKKSLDKFNTFVSHVWIKLRVEKFKIGLHT